MPVDMTSALPTSGAYPHTVGQSHSHGVNDEDDVVGLGVPHGSDDGDDATRQQREEEYMDEMIMKHRSEFQSFVARALDVNVSAASGNGGGSSKADHRENLQNVAPSRGSDKATPRLDPNFRTPQPKRPNTSERLLQLSRTERTDRMRLAELSDVRNEKLGRDAILRWNPNAKRADDLDNRTYGAEGAGRRNGAPSTRGRERSHTTPSTPTTARMLGEMSKDFVQQAIDFTNHELLTDDDDDADRRDVGNEDDDDDDDLDLEPPLQTDVDDLIDRQLRGPLSNKKMRKYVKHVKHMETTIAQLVQQKEELIRNQAEFDKHASGMFPTLENLNNQLSQLVQDRLQQSQVNIKDDLDSELRSLRVRLNELEADARQRRNDAELDDQKNQLDMAQIKTEVASLGTTGSLQNHKIELIMSQIKQLQQEIHQSVQVTKSLSSQYQTIDNRITTIQVSLKEETRSQPAQKPKSAFGWAALVVVIVAIVTALLTADRCSGWFGRCRPLT